MNIADGLTDLLHPVADLHELPGNPRRGDVEAVKASYERFGQRKPIVVRTADDGQVVVVAGNHQLKAVRELGWEQVAVVWADDLTADEATAFALADNRVADLGSYDDADLLAMLSDVSDDALLLGATGYDLDFIEQLTNDSTVDDIGDVTDELRGGAGAPDGSLSHNIDAYFNASPVLVKLGTTTGFAAGIISRSVTESYLRLVEVMNIDVGFVDNEFKDYDHAQHVAAVSSLSPKYATVRDLMTKEQCDASGIAYFSFDEVMDMARDVQQHAENVIVIPKYDCLSDIPADLMLGYSVPTKYGGTPLDPKLFAGRRVHLLGGSWKMQRNAIGVLGSSVVSLDNNHMMNVARWGQAYSQHGKQLLARDVLPGHYGNMVCIILSMSNIVADLSRAGASVNGRRFLSKEQGVVAELNFDLDDPTTMRDEADDDR